MHRASRHISICATVALAALAAFAASQQPAVDPKHAYLKMLEGIPPPSKEHDALACFVGEFDQKTTVSAVPGQSFDAKSRASGRWVAGRRFVEIDSASTPDEELKGERVNVFGWDPAAKRYTLWGVESDSDIAYTATGTYDAAKLAFTFDGERTVRGAATPFRWTIEVHQDGSLAQTIALKFNGSADYAPLARTNYTRDAK